MTQDEGRRLVALIAQIWKNYDYADPQVEIRMWLYFLEGRNYSDVQRAVYEFAKTDTKGFAPTPGQIIGILDRKPEPMINAQAYRIEESKEVPGACPMPDDVKAKFEDMKRRWGYYES